MSSISLSVARGIGEMFLSSGPPYVGGIFIGEGLAVELLWIAKERHRAEYH
jgi:hypothetical protein